MADLKRDSRQATLYPIASANVHSFAARTDLRDFVQPATDAPEAYPLEAFARDLSEANRFELNAHSYHTNVPFRTIIPYIEHYTRPGETVLDPFCGSGMTGLAALACGRRAIMSDLAPAATHIARNNATPVNLAAFRDAFKTLSSLHREAIGKLYKTACRNCKKATEARYYVWSEVGACEVCKTETTLYDVQADGGKFRCTVCKADKSRQEFKFITVKPLFVSYECSRCGGREDPVDDADRRLITATSETSIREFYPTTPFEKTREMWRAVHAAYGVDTVDKFFTRRNLQALAWMWKTANDAKLVPDADVRARLQFAITATMVNTSRMVVCMPNRDGRRNLNGTLYIPALTLEQNVWNVFERRFRRVEKAAALTNPLTTRASNALRISTQSATDLSNIPSNSLDYCFTDPPFGANIFYSDLNLIWESWLQNVTDNSLEAVMTVKSDEKPVEAYELLMLAAFEEIYRVLKPGRWASVVFQNTDDKVWLALQRACAQAGFNVEGAAHLDKGWFSFKGIKGKLGEEDVQSVDIVLSLQKPVNASETRKTLDAVENIKDTVLAIITKHLETSPPRLHTTSHIHLAVLKSMLAGRLELAGMTMDLIRDLLLSNGAVENENHEWMVPSTWPKRN